MASMRAASTSIPPASSSCPMLLLAACCCLWVWCECGGSVFCLRRDWIPNRHPAFVVASMVRGWRERLDWIRLVGCAIRIDTG
jgi:hypothetical protein